MDFSHIPDEVLEAIRTRISLVDVVSSHVALRKAGKNWKGLCPFHGEKTPSFIVNEERGTYHCFGCGAGGTVFRFLMEAEGRTFREAVELLAARAGVPLRLAEESAEGRKVREERDVLLEMLDLAARYYRHQLLEGRSGQKARDYLRERGIDAEASQTFQLGCAPEGWDALSRYLSKKGFDLVLAAKAGLVTARASGGYYDRFRDRLIFPITDPSGRTVSFGGRVLGQGEPKYLNGPESPVFRKSETLYGIAQGMEALRRDRKALLVEGYMDVVALHSVGYRPALATLGTSLTREHAQALKRRTDEAVLIYDGDEAGRKATFRCLEIFLAEGFPCRAVMLPPEHDPDSFVRAGGDLSGLIRGARPLFVEFLEDLSSRMGRGTVEGRLRAVEELVPNLRAVPASLARDLYIRESAERLGVSEPLLRERLGAEGGAASRGADVASVTDSVDPVERALVKCLVHEPEHRDAFLARGVSEWMRSPPLKEAALYVASRSEGAETLPSDGAPERARVVLSQVLVDESGPLAGYEVLEAKLRLRELEARSASLLRAMRDTASRGEEEGVTALQREKMELDRTIGALRRRVGG